VHLLVSELYTYQNARCNDKENFKKMYVMFQAYRKTYQIDAISEHEEVTTS